MNRTCEVCDRPLDRKQAYTCSHACKAERRRRQNRQDPYHGQPTLRDPKWSREVASMRRWVDQELP